MTTLRQAVLEPLCLTQADDKAEAGLSLDLNLPVSADQLVEAQGAVPGRPTKPILVPPTEVKQRSVHTLEGRATLIHAICHIELNAIDLACDIVWRFPCMPDLFYVQWAQIAKEEALHFSLLRDHLRQMGYEYGDFPAHNGLWEMAEKTKDDLLARLALVPRTLEARGLDASPPIKKKLVQAGDVRAGEILDVILRDEIGHVAVGNRWFGYLCEQRDLDPVQTYAELAEKYDAPRLRGPFNLDARRQAGFSEVELKALQG
ncbi:uncharacterized ferritin-like protein (DUF455 family) [Hydrogenophaga palleronii]|uniref:Uncharacterized ferritin-like protein (DUF455 family) n=1 Tax=Hydrogenophaga palleronii TaxID=65655 RepID=A0ABU1WIL2_9BURK|nr:ferritin-like domain-containing protein [Hydrogenophaga palleronii]MDR7149111.1 uncharacterized ferritin-like protein (DUF455 family) [Hydrogenophaga palleronii]